MARILVCEDNGTQAFHLKMILESAGHDVVVADDDADTLALLASSTSFELVLANLQSERVSGLGLCRSIRQQLQRWKLPVVLLATYGEMNDLSRGAQVGASAYVLKPYQPDDLLRSLKEALDAAALAPDGPMPGFAMLEADRPVAEANSNLADPTSPPPPPPVMVLPVAPPSPPPAAPPSPPPAESPSAPPLVTAAPPPRLESTTPPPFSATVLSSRKMRDLMSKIIELSDDAVANCYDPEVIDRLMAIGETARQARNLASESIL